MRYQMYSLVSSSAYQSNADGRMALSYIALIDGEHAEYGDEAERLERLRDLMIQRMWLSYEQLTGLYDHWGYQVGGYPLENYLETEEFAEIRAILEERGILIEGAANNKGSSRAVPGLEPWLNKPVSALELAKGWRNPHAGICEGAARKWAVLPQ